MQKVEEICRNAFGEVETPPIPLPKPIYNSDQQPKSQYLRSSQIPVNQKAS
jgi:hypothetical protein